MERTSESSNDNYHINIDYRDLPVNTRTKVAVWCGNSITVLKKTAIPFGTLALGGVATGIGIYERKMEIYVSGLIATALLETAYFGYKAYRHFRLRSYHLPYNQTKPELSQINGHHRNERKPIAEAENLSGTLSRETHHNLDFFDNFMEQYFNKTDYYDFDTRQKLLNQLKDSFPSYFHHHKDLNTVLLLDQARCQDILEGINRHYKLDTIRSQPFMAQHGYTLLPTQDDGDCLYDAIWQGLSNNIRETLALVPAQTSNESATLLDPEQPGYLVLKKVLSDAADKNRYQELILKNGTDPTCCLYTTIKEYKRLLKEKDKFWGRHNVEGKILAEELGFNLVLIGGCNFTPGVGIVERDDEAIYHSQTADNDVYIDNRYLHYSSVKKCQVHVIDE